MTDASTHPDKILGVMGEFNDPALIVQAARVLKEAGFSRMEAFTPMPVDELTEYLGRERAIVPALVLCGALFGAIGAFSFMTWTWVVDYPINIGGRPMFSWPAYIPITFEMAVLVGCYAGGIGMLLLNRLPRLSHPVFDVPGFERASQDRFFLMVEVTDPCFARDQVTALFQQVDALSIAEVPCA